MRAKRKLFLTAAFTALLGVSVFAGVSSIKEASEVEAAGSGWYLTGSGSFMSGTEWDKNSGVELNASSGNKGALLNFYLVEGDIFKITDDSFWAGWDRNAGIDTSYFEHTSYVKSDKSKATVYFDHTSCTWWADASSKTVVNMWGGASDHTISDTLSGPSGFIDVYTDNTTIKFERSAWSGNYVQLTPPSNWSTHNAFKLNSDGNGGSWQYYCDSAYGSNIRVKKTGYYDIYFNSESNVYIAPVTTLLPGDALYLNVNAQSNWNGKTPKVHFWNSSHISEAVDLNMTEVHGSGLSTKLYEVKVPSLASANPNFVIFYHDDWADKTGDLSVVNSSNKYKLTSNSSGTWDGFIFKADRAEYYGTYFNTCVVCSGSGSITTDKWSDAKTEYLNMCANAQGVVWTSDTSSTGTQLQKAMSKYDYIIHKYPSKMADDFINRKESPQYPYGSITNPIEQIVSTNNGSMVVIIAITSVSLAAIGGYFLFKKKHQ